MIIKCKRCGKEPVCGQNLYSKDWAYMCTNQKCPSSVTDLWRKSIQKAAEDWANKNMEDVVIPNDVLS